MARSGLQYRQSAPSLLAYSGPGAQVVNGLRPCGNGYSGQLARLTGRPNSIGQWDLRRIAWRNIQSKGLGALLLTGSRPRRKFEDFILNHSMLHRLPVFRTLSLACCCAALFCSAAQAQSPVLVASAVEPAPVSSSSLPDAPDALLTPKAGAGYGQAGALSTAPVAGPYAMIIQPGQTAPRISKRTEVIAGIRDTFTVFTAIGWVASTGYSYGTRRLRRTTRRPAKALRRAWEHRLLAHPAKTFLPRRFSRPVLHEDARYYRMGKGPQLLVKRLAYAGTRELITRTDGGRQTLNIRESGRQTCRVRAALTTVYYPAINTSGSEVFKTFGGSVGGSASGLRGRRVSAGYLPSSPVKRGTGGDGRYFRAPVQPTNTTACCTPERCSPFDTSRPFM